MSQNNKGRKLFEELEAGYKKMTDISREIAEFGIEADNECLLEYEEKLTECD